MHKKKRIGNKQMCPKYSEEIEQLHHFNKSNNNESSKNNILQTVQKDPVHTTCFRSKKYRSVCFANKRSKILSTPPSIDFNIELKNKNIYTVYDALSLNIIKNIKLKKSQKNKIKNTHFQYLQKAYNFYKTSNKLLDHHQLSTACKFEPKESVSNNRDFDQTMSNMPTSIVSVCSPNIFVKSPVCGKPPEINISQQNYDIKSNKQFNLSEHVSFLKEKVLKCEFQFKNSYLNYVENQFAKAKDYSIIPKNLLSPDAVKLKNAELLKIGGKINTSNNENNEPSTSTKPCVRVWCCNLSQTKTLNSQLSKTIETKITPHETCTFSKTYSEIIKKEEDYSRIEGTKKIVHRTLTYPESEKQGAPYHIKTNSKRAITEYTHFPSETKKISLEEIYLDTTEMEETSSLSELSSEVADTEDVPSSPVSYNENIVFDRPLLPRTYSRRVVKNTSYIPKIYPENNIKQILLSLKYLEKIVIDYPKSISKMYLTEKKVNFMKDLGLILTKKMKK